MKKKICYFLLFVGLSIFYFPQLSNAEPAEMRGFVELSQPTKQSFKAEIRGDEWLSYAVVEDTQELLILGEKNYWFYASIHPETKELKATTSKYLIDSKPENVAYEKDLSQVHFNQPEEIIKENKALRTIKGQKQNRNLLVVMIEFNDTPLEYSKSDWYNKIFASQQESVNDYYNEATKGMIQFNPVKNTQVDDTQDGVIKVKLNKNHPNSGFLSDAEGKFTLPREMLNEALNQAKNDLNLKQYDKNNSGVITPDELHVLAIFSGYAASATNATTGVSPTIWPHRWGGKINVDGLSLNTYTAVSDKRKYYSHEKDNQSTIGTIVHELGHDLGLPDLYNPVGTTGQGLGRYSVMSDSHTTMNGKLSGSYPAHFDAYSKVQLGIVEPTIINTSQTLSINELQQDDVNIAKIETSDPNQYYLIENRQPKGFDAAMKGYIHSGGIGIYYVNENIAKNNGVGEQIVTLKEADESQLGYSKLNAGMYSNLDGFYYRGMNIKGTRQVTELTRTTTPSSLLPDNSPIDFDISIEDYSQDKMNVSFKRKVDAIQISSIESEVEAGQTLKLSATISPEDAHDKSMLWSVSDDTVATITEDGLLTAKKSGKVIVTVTSKDTGVKDSMTLTVKSNYFGTVPWEWEEQTQTITFGEGAFPNTINNNSLQKAIEKNSQLNGMKIKHIVFTKPIELAENSSYLFSNLTELISINNIQQLHTNNVKNMSNLFDKTSKLRSLDLSSFNTSKVTNMSGMFNEAFSLATIDLSSFNTENVSTMKSMFGRTHSLTKIDLSNFNTSNVTDMSHMFYGIAATSLDLSNFNTGKVKNMYAMFYAASAIKELNLSNFKTENVTTMFAAFSGMNALTKINLSSFAIENVKDVRQLFHKSDKLETIVLGKKSRLPNYVYLSTKENYPHSGKWIHKESGEKYTSNDDFLSNHTESGTYFREVYQDNHFGTVPWKWDESTQTITFGKGEFPDTRMNTSIHSIIENDKSLQGKKIKRIVFTQPIELAENSSYLFSYLYELTDVKNSNYLNTKKVIDMTSMFSYAKALSKIDLSSFNLESLEQSKNMFSFTQMLDTLILGQHTKFNGTENLIIKNTYPYSGKWIH
ncbi:M6 family metalloprotease domain-containing protein, partial [Enterococcus termitis]